ncbi:hypothetical protein GVAMD_0881 [Gardnerella vaginalis AMD]|nr:hypothetical protein GVAMD_0881 [Gardnerella vaginalis AMD]
MLLHFALEAFLIRRAREISKLRQKLYSGVKKRSVVRGITAETLQQRTVYAAYAPKNGRNFTWV